MTKVEEKDINLEGQNKGQQKMKDANTLLEKEKLMERRSKALKA